jgi:hypothetical protein
MARSPHIATAASTAAVAADWAADDSSTGNRSGDTFHVFICREASNP